VRRQSSNIAGANPKGVKDGENNVGQAGSVKEDSAGIRDSGRLTPKKGVGHGERQKVHWTFIREKRGEKYGSITHDRRGEKHKHLKRGTRKRL